MPPQQTNVTPETGRKAAGRGLDLPVALAKHAMVEALAVPHLNASIATRDDAVSEKDAEPPATSTRSVLGLLKRYWRAFQARRQRQSLGALSDLSDRQLIDVGLTRDEIDCIALQLAIDRLRDSTTHLWSRGMI